MKAHSFIKIVFAFLVLVCIGFGSFFLYKFEQPNRFSLLLSTARADFAKGDFDAAIQASAQAVALAPTESDATDAKFVLAGSLYERGKGNDLATATAYYKSFILNPNDTLYKSSAYVHLGSFYFSPPQGSNSTSTLLQQLVFNTPPFTEYLTQTNGNVMAAAIALYQQSIAYRPSADAYSRIALIQAIELHHEGINPKSNSQIKVARSIRQEITAEDALLGTMASSSSINSIVVASALWRDYYARARALGTIFYYFPDISNSLVDAGYERALSVGNTASSTDSITKQQVLFLSVSYSASLNARENGLQNKKIQALLSNFSFKAGAYPLVDQYLLSIRKLPANDVVLRQIPLLAKLSPVFSAYLSSIGWKTGL